MLLLAKALGLKKGSFGCLHPTLDGQSIAPSIEAISEYDTSKTRGHLEISVAKYARSSNIASIGLITCKLDLNSKIGYITEIETHPNTMLLHNIVRLKTFLTLKHCSTSKDVNGALMSNWHAFCWYISP